MLPYLCISGVPGCTFKALLPLTHCAADGLGSIPSAAVPARGEGSHLATWHQHKPWIRVSATAHRSGTVTKLGKPGCDFWFAREQKGAFIPCPKTPAFRGAPEGGLSDSFPQKTKELGFIPAAHSRHNLPQATRSAAPSQQRRSPGAAGAGRGKGR